MARFKLRTEMREDSYGKKDSANYMIKKAKIRSMYGKMQELKRQERDVEEDCRVSSDRVRRREKKERSGIVNGSEGMVKLGVERKRVSERMNRCVRM